MTKEQFEGWLMARIKACKAAQRKLEKGTPKYIAIGGKLTALKATLDFVRTHNPCATSTSS